LNSSLMNGPSVYHADETDHDRRNGGKKFDTCFQHFFRFARCNLCDKSALAIPIGIEIIPAPAVTKIEPMISG